MIYLRALCGKGFLGFFLRRSVNTAGLSKRNSRHAKQIRLFPLSRYGQGPVAGRSHLEIIKEAIAGGVTTVQLREKELDSGEFYIQAMQIRQHLRSCSCPLIINDRVDIALAVDAEGVHIGQSDLPLPVVRKMLGPGKIIGVSVFTPEEAREAEVMGADYRGLSPIFTTATKPELVCQLGFEGIGPIRQATKLPLVGIGSMNKTNAFEAVRCGLDGVAVVSAICSQPDVCTAAALIRGEVDRGKASRATV